MFVWPSSTFSNPKSRRVLLGSNISPTRPRRRENGLNMPSTRSALVGWSSRGAVIYTRPRSSVRVADLYYEFLYVLCSHCAEIPVVSCMFFFFVILCFCTHSVSTRVASIPVPTQSLVVSCMLFFFFHFKGILLYVKTIVLFFPLQRNPSIC